MASGGARLDIRGPILMPQEELRLLVRRAPGVVLANHLEALNHCPISRKMSLAELAGGSLTSQVIIVEDGETLSLQG